MQGEGRWVLKMPFGRQKRQRNSMGEPKHVEEAGINRSKFLEQKDDRMERRQGAGISLLIRSEGKKN